MHEKFVSELCQKLRIRIETFFAKEGCSKKSECFEKSNSVLFVIYFAYFRDILHILQSLD